jgi:hypothetical protein
VGDIGIYCRIATTVVIVIVICSRKSYCICVDICFLMAFPCDYCSFVLDSTLYDTLHHMHHKIVKLEHRVHNQQSQVMLLFAKWNQDLVTRQEESEASSQSAANSRGGSRDGSVGESGSLSGSTRMSLMQRDAWLAQLKIEREQQQKIDEANRIQFFVEAEMMIEDLLAAQYALSCALEKKLGIMVCIETSYEDALMGADRQQLLTTDDYISNTRSLSAKVMELDVVLCYAAFCFQRSDLSERVKNGTPIARLESSASVSEKVTKKAKDFNPRKGVRFRIKVAPQLPLTDKFNLDESSVNADNNYTDADKDKDEDENDAKSEDEIPGSMARTVFTSVLETDQAPSEDHHSGDLSSEVLDNMCMYPPPGSASDLLGSCSDDCLEETPVQRKKKKKEKKVMSEEEEEERPITPAERKAMAREKKKQRSISRERDRRMQAEAANDLEDEDTGRRSPPDHPSLRLTASASFTFSDTDDLDCEGGERDELDPLDGSGTPKKKKKKKKRKTITEEETVQEQELEPEEETLGQRRVRKRAEAKALKLSEAEAAAALLPPIKVEKVEKEERPLTTKAQRRRDKRAAMKGIEKRGMVREDSQESLFSQSNHFGHSGSRDDDAPPISRGNSFFSSSFKNMFGLDKYLEGPNPRDKKQSEGGAQGYRRQETVTLERFDPLLVTEVNVPRSSDGSMRLRLKYLDSGDIVPGFYVIGFKPECAARGVVRERDKVEEIGGQSLTGMDLEEVFSLLNSTTDSHVPFSIKRSTIKNKKPLLRQYSGSDLPPPKVVTQQMVDDKEAEVEKAYVAKKKAKKKIKLWTKEFEKRENRVVSEEDKRLAPDVFKPLDQVTNL